MMKETIDKIPDSIRGSVREISQEEILTLRLMGKKRTIFKVDNKFYLLVSANKGKDKSQKDKDMPQYAFGSHLCSNCMFVKNGKLCPKIADLSKESSQKYHLSLEDALIFSKRIEKYDFITRGVEGFNYDREFLIVAECKRYETNQCERQKREQRERNEFASRLNLWN